MVYRLNDDELEILQRAIAPLSPAEAREFLSVLEVQLLERFAAVGPDALAVFVAQQQRERFPSLIVPSLPAPTKVEDQPDEPRVTVLSSLLW
jgi:hypothetical protein